MKWEYKAIGIRQRENEEFEAYRDLVIRNFNLVGSNDWELVSVDNGIAYFKRPIQPKSEAEILAEFDKPRERVWRSMTPKEIAAKEVPTKQVYDD